jgi:hypothetical protein
LFKKLTAGISLATRSCFTTFINGTSSPNLNTFNSQSVSSRFDRVLDYNSNKLLYKNPPFSNSRTYWGGEETKVCPSSHLYMDVARISKTKTIPHAMYGLKLDIYLAKAGKGNGCGRNT